MKRRTFLQSSMAAGIAAIAAGAGLLTPRAVLAAYPKAQFKAESVEAALGGSFEDSDDIRIKAPDIAENGAVVPVKVTTDIAGATAGFNFQLVLTRWNGNAVEQFAALRAGQVVDRYTIAQGNDGVRRRCWRWSRRCRVIGDQRSS